jgi:hypothetical protein
MEKIKKILIEFLRIVSKNETIFSIGHQLVIPLKSQERLNKIAGLVLGGQNDVFLKECIVIVRMYLKYR